MISDFKILRRPGWRINPDDNKVNEILHKLYENDGLCPTLVHNRVGHSQCPCSEYIQRSICHCGLYVKENSNENNSEHKPIQNFSSYGGC